MIMYKWYIVHVHMKHQIDRELVNSLWITKYPHVVVDYMNLGLFDHSSSFDVSV